MHPHGQNGTGFQCPDDARHLKGVVCEDVTSRQKPEPLNEALLSHARKQSFSGILKAEFVEKRLGQTPALPTWTGQVRSTLLVYFVV